MNIKSFIKKYGILCIVALVFLVAIIYFAVDSSKDVIRGKTVDGKDVVVSMDGYNLTADDLYDKLLDSSYGGYAVYMYYVRAVVDASMEDTDTLKAYAESAAESLLSTYESYGEDALNEALRSAGLTNKDQLVDYYLTYYKLNDMLAQYEEDHMDELFKPFFEEMQPRRVSHILVQCEDSENPTEEEKAKMKEIEDALAAGTSFEEVAKEYSDDGSASDGGDLGYVDADTSFVTEFLEASLALNTNEMSEWVKTQYGYHLILVTASDYDTMKADDDAIAAMENYYPYLELQVIKNAAKDLDITFEDERIEELLNNFFTSYLGEEEE